VDKETDLLYRVNAKTDLQKKGYSWRHSVLRLLGGYAYAKTQHKQTKAQLMS
jgi:hypothetical protein